MIRNRKFIKMGEIINGNFIVNIKFHHFSCLSIKDLLRTIFDLHFNWMKFNIIFIIFWKELSSDEISSTMKNMHWKLFLCTTSILKKIDLPSAQHPHTQGRLDHASVNDVQCWPFLGRIHWKNFKVLSKFQDYNLATPIASSTKCCSE